MSFEAISWAIKQDIPRSTEKFCLLMLANYAGYDGFSYPSVERLAVDLSQDRKTVIKSLKSLEKIGIICDTGRRVGATKSVVVYELVGLPTEEKYNYLYKLTNPETGEYYIGIRSSKVHPQSDPYMGSGAWPKECIEKEIFLAKEIIQVFETYEEARVAENNFFRSMVFDDGLCRNSQTIYHLRKRAYQTDAVFRQKVDSGKAPPVEGSSPVFPTKQSQKRYLEPIREPIINSDTTYRSDDVIPIDDNYDEPPDDGKTFWDEAAGMLKSLGLVDKTARSMTGRFLKLSGNDQEKVIRAITEAVDVGTNDPIPYVSAILKGRKSQKKKEVDDAFAELRAASEARKAQWREQGLLEDDDAGGRSGIDPVGVQPEQHEKPKPIRKATRRSYGTISARRVAEVMRPDERIAIDPSFPPDSGGSEGSRAVPF